MISGSILVSLAALSLLSIRTAVEVPQEFKTSDTLLLSCSRGVGVIRSERDDRCYLDSLENAAKCKCSLMHDAYPRSDIRVRYCTGAFGTDLIALRGSCARFYGNAIARQNLIAMFEIGLLGSECAGCSRIGSRTFAKSGHDSMGRDALSPALRETNACIETILRY